MLNKKFEFLILISFLVLCAHQADSEATTDQQQEGNVNRKRKGRRMKSILKQLCFITLVKIEFHCRQITLTVGGSITRYGCG